MKGNKIQIWALDVFIFEYKLICHFDNHSFFWYSYDFRNDFGLLCLALSSMLP